MLFAEFPASSIPDSFLTFLRNHIESGRGMRDFRVTLTKWVL